MLLHLFHKCRFCINPQNVEKHTTYGSIYQTWKNVGFGLGLRTFLLSVEDKGDSVFNGKFEYNYWGPAAYVIGNF